MIWLYRDTGDTNKVIDLSIGIFWAVLPSLFFFIVLPALLKMGMKFGWAMTLSSVIMFLGYGLYLTILGRLGIKA